MTSSSFPPPADVPDTEPDPEWTRRFARSSRDRKLGGVAGGIGRALGIDPVLVRVAFAVLTIFGGSGVSLYVLGWLLLPGEKDEVSAAESLLGRGRSSVSPGLTIVLGIVLIISVTSTFTVGLPLLPIAIGALVVTAIVGHRRRRECRHSPGRDRAHPGWADEQRISRQVQDFSDRAARWGEELGRKAEVWGDDLGRKAERWADNVGRRAEHWGSGLGHRGHGRRRSAHDRHRTVRARRTAAGPSTGASPFDRPPFWEESPTPGSRPVDLTKSGAATDPAPAAGTSPSSASSPSFPPAPPPPAPPAEPAGPPQWDPLGAAPFAWDLPEPGPQPPSPQEVARERRGKLFSRAVIGVALLVAGTMSLGQAADWWTLNWAFIAAAALAVIALGVFVSALRGHRSNLIGIGVTLSLVTAALTVFGIDGRDGFGDRSFSPTTVAEVQPSYRLSGGNLRLDLSDLDVAPSTKVTTEVSVSAGQVEVILPRDVAVEVTCESLVGSMTCLDQTSDGFQNSQQVSKPGAKDAGTIVLDATARAGDVQVRRG